MELNEKLQELRKQKGITQEELAKSLYVSRTAISKWESGRGYPNIESLKAIAAYFSITVDELLSADEILTIAEKDGKEKDKHYRDLVYGLLDLSMVMLLFLPFFAMKSEKTIEAISLISFLGSSSYLRIPYFAVVICMAITGVMTLALQNTELDIWLKSKTAISFILGIASLLLFIISLQPYAAVFSFVLLLIKTLLLLIKRK